MLLITVFTSAKSPGLGEVTVISSGPLNPGPNPADRVS